MNERIRFQKSLVFFQGTTELLLFPHEVRCCFILLAWRESPILVENLQFCFVLLLFPRQPVQRNSTNPRSGISKRCYTCMSSCYFQLQQPEYQFTHCTNFWKHDIKVKAALSLPACFHFRKLLPLTFFKYLLTLFFYCSSSWKLIIINLKTFSCKSVRFVVPFHLLQDHMTHQSSVFEHDIFSLCFDTTFENCSYQSFTGAKT